MMDMNVNRNRGTKRRVQCIRVCFGTKQSSPQFPDWLFSLDSNFKTTFLELQKNAKCVFSVRRANPNPNPNFHHSDTVWLNSGVCFK